MGFLDFILPSTKRNKRPVVTPTQEVSADEFNRVVSAVDELRNAHLNGELRNRDTEVAAAASIRQRARSARLEIYEPSSSRWRRVLDSDDVRDVREFLSEGENTSYELGTTVNATGAVQDILADLATATGKMFVPTHSTLLEIEETCELISNASNSVALMGAVGSARGASKGSGFKWVGAAGGTMLDLRGCNNSEICDLFLHGNQLAKYPLRIREYRNNDVTLLAACQNINVRRCTVYKPDSTDPTSACVALGQATAGNTFQTSEVRFFECVIHGSGGANGGYGILALEDGNCKNFEVWSCYFLELLRGIKTGAGFLVVQGVLGTNIGYSGGTTGALIVSGADVVKISGVGLESGDVGFSCRLAESTHANSLMEVDAAYAAAITPADDYIIKAAGQLKVRNSKLGPNYRVGAESFKIQANPVGVEIEGVGFVTQTANSLATAPVYDGSNNLLTNGDYAKLSVANNKVWCRNNASSGTGGVSGVLDNKLRDTISGHYDDVRDQILTDNNTSGVVVVSDVAGRYVVRVPFSVFAAAGANDIIIGRLNYETRLEHAMAKVTVGLSGGAITTPLVALGVKFGSGGGDIDVDGLVDEFDGSAIASFGALDAELGAQLQAKAGYVSKADHLNELRVKLTVGGGTIASINAGSITFTVAHKRLGV